MCSLSELSEVVAENDHDTLKLFPINSLSTVIQERTPEGPICVIPKVINTCTGEWMGCSILSTAAINRHAEQYV